MEEHKEYLGDSVYISVEYSMVKLTTENGGPEPSNTIYLGPDEIKALMRYVDALAKEDAK